MLWVWQQKVASALVGWRKTLAIVGRKRKKHTANDAFKDTKFLGRTVEIVLKVSQLTVNH